MAYYKSYLIRVTYRNADTRWRWRSHKLVRSRICYPHPRPRWTRTEDVEVRRARARAAQMRLYEQEVLGVGSADYLHPMALPVIGGCPYGLPLLGSPEN